MSEAPNADVQIPAGAVMPETPRRGDVLARGLLIGGKSVPASSGKVADDVSPSDREINARVAGTPRCELLGAQERVPGRPFTDPDRTLADGRVMDRMLGLLRREARSWPGRRTSVELVKYTRAGCRHWLVVPNAPALGSAQDVTAVGFFGDQRPGMNHDAIYQLEADVVARLGRYAPMGLLGYYDAEIAPAVHGNLVLFGTREVPAGWHTDRVHAAAVAIAPHHYCSVRLHRGMVGGALLGRGHLVIQRTRYFDFGQQPAWHGLRRFG